MSPYAPRSLWLAEHVTPLADAYMDVCLKECITVLIQCTTSDSTGQRKSASTNGLLPTPPLLSQLCRPHRAARVAPVKVVG